MMLYATLKRWFPVPNLVPNLVSFIRIYVIKINFAQSSHHNITIKDLSCTIAAIILIMLI